MEKLAAFGMVSVVSEGAIEIESAERECLAFARESPVARFSPLERQLGVKGILRSLKPPQRSCAPRRDRVSEQRYLIWKHCHENSAAGQSEKARITEEANRKRSEAAKAQPRSEDGTKLPKLAAKEPEPVQEEFLPEQPKEPVEQVVEQTVPAPDSSDNAKKSKAAKSKTNRGAVARGDLGIGRVKK